jgi:hypothetical protein
MFVVIRSRSLSSTAEEKERERGTGHMKFTLMRKSTCRCRILIWGSGAIEALQTLNGTKEEEGGDEAANSNGRSVFEL